MAAFLAALNSEEVLEGEEGAEGEEEGGGPVIPKLPLGGSATENVAEEDALEAQLRLAEEEATLLREQLTARNPVPEEPAGECWRERVC